MGGVCELSDIGCRAEFDRKWRELTPDEQDINSLI
jgi:hypothetical protein